MRVTCRGNEDPVEIEITDRPGRSETLSSYCSSGTLMFSFPIIEKSGVRERNPSWPTNCWAIDETLLVFFVHLARFFSLEPRPLCALYCARRFLVPVRSHAGAKRERKIAASASTSSYIVHHRKKTNASFGREVLGHIYMYRIVLGASCLTPPSFYQPLSTPNSHPQTRTRRSLVHRSVLSDQEVSKVQNYLLH